MGVILQQLLTDHNLSPLLNVSFRSELRRERGLLDNDPSPQAQSARDLQVLLSISIIQAWEVGLSSAPTLQFQISVTLMGSHFY